MTGRTTQGGGCQCGRIRYTATYHPDGAYLCHCRMCQRATGGVSIAFMSLPKTNLQWETQPEWYASSTFAKRPFCQECGTPLGFAFDEGDDMDIAIGTLDDPYGLEPQWHFGVERMHEAWIDTSHLPHKRADESEQLVNRWKDSNGCMPE
ncbi:GFA family protein [Qipengyuania sp. 1NDW9]|uniref:GFA family protein n=2 Tax=Qipengyuania xiapuensis TaxID=2867236 RepID=A0ABX8ZU67_9SPHN|nr:GFA family protein [Qipengyuania xiapuensis]MBX7493323.1 GFA family protein [Qipengyuania xiapuensis]QZD92546.1 GFA family protein [Qipengyuania xiapuensis]